jgi:hypothetical protein
MAQGLLSNFTIKKVTIANGQATSSAVDCLGMVLLGIVFPSAWTAAKIDFQGSVDGGASYQTLYDEDGDARIEWTSAAASRILLASGTSEVIGGLTQLKVRSETAGADTNQGQAVTLQLIFGVVNP